MSTPPPDVVEFQRTERGLEVWFDVEEKLALGSLFISSSLLGADFEVFFGEADLAKLTPGERAHVADARDRLARARRSS